MSRARQACPSATFRRRRRAGRRGRCRRTTRACGGTRRRDRNRAGASTSRIRATRSSRPGSPTTRPARRLWLAMTASHRPAPACTRGTLLPDTGPAVQRGAVRSAAACSGTAGRHRHAHLHRRRTTGTFAYTVNGVTQTKTITRQVFGPLPTCTFGIADRPDAGLQLPGPVVGGAGGVESGWGVNLTHQGDTIFATWFTYDLDGTPMWLVGRRRRRPRPGTYGGTLYRTTGPPFNAVPFDPTAVVAHRGRHRDVHVHRRQHGNVRVHGQRRDADQGDHARGVPGARHRLPVTRGTAYGGASRSATPAALSAAASRAAARSSETRSSMSASGADALELDDVEFRAVDEQDRAFRALHHRALDRAAGRIRVRHAVGA